MSLACYCDYESPRWYASKVRRARKVHKCEECEGLIAVGEQYEAAWGVMDWGEKALYGQNLRSMPDSANMGQKRYLPCFCWAHGNLNDDMDNAIVDARWRAPQETQGLWFGYGRLLVARIAHTMRLLAMNLWIKFEGPVTFPSTGPYNGCAGE